MIKIYVEDKGVLEGIIFEIYFVNDFNINFVYFVDIILDMEEVFDIEIDDEFVE